MIINRPNGTDVYKGVLKDYTGDVSQRAPLNLRFELVNGVFAVHSLISCVFVI